MIAGIIVLEIISSYPKYPPHIDKDLKNPLILGSLNNSISKDSFTSYQYEVLPEGYIRLVHIKAGTPEDPIELELKSIRFRPFKLTGWIPEKYIPHYEALSYTWEENGKEDNLPGMVNGQPFYITANLHSALLAIRRNPISLPLWIDAICIDQKDNVEKEQQLRIMHQIYKNATKCARLARQR
ncbi:hypothetical protein DID88_006931 [Monilinia fructigena]|uniref:Heterokaryon incompatibility domain-containing protein n=1 Tax=Monilinia fructigena TaxID=38457 RepID=A0A395IGL9_9HELO|nr:hypothetical protein DID88_006931 [Monilinia fructigena]